MIKHKNTAADRPYPLMWEGHDYEPLPLESLTMDMCDIRIIAPYCVAIRFFSTTDQLLVGRDNHGASLAGRHILPDDQLIYDGRRTAPEDGAIQWVQDSGEWVPRVCHILADGAVEFHAAAEGYPILTGERRIYGTLAAVVRATDGREVAR